MRAIWSGSITFGLVNVPVKAYSAAKKHDIGFHQVHDADGGRIRYQRRCEVCGKKIDYEHIDKAYEDGEQTVVLTDEDFEALPEAQNDEIEVAQFVPSEQIDPVMFGKSYFLEPQGKSPKSYLLLRQALWDTDRTAVVTFALRQKTRLGALRVQDDVLVLQSMYWADEIREVDFPATRSRAGIGAKEKKLAAALVDQFASDFTPEEFEDTYQVELRRLIDAKFEQGDALDTEATFGVVEGEDEGGDAEVIDLMQALKASLDRKRGGRGSRKAGSTTSSAQKSSAKKTGAKKAGAQKSGSKGAGAQKTGAKKSGATSSSRKKSGAQKTGPQKASAQKSGAKKASPKKSARSSASDRKSA